MLDREKVRDVYLEAAGLPEAERAALLDRRCAGDVELRAEVESLLAAAARRPRLLESPTAAPPGVPGEVAGSRIGPYRLVREIGQGGFGTVYEAEQEAPVRRRVALKIIKLGMDTRAVIARFEAERQALAIMDHANIARVFEAGATESGRPYFVMELVAGSPITAYCDERRLGVRERLGLFVQVCRAVQHAHAKGVIHRDIKPSNVLVAVEDGRAVAKVIDFGIAKATDQRLTEKTLFTQERQLVGTPEYMSPEQAGGEADIDTRTDVYSLGVLLYELLTGATPFDAQRLRSAAFDELRRIIREDDPPAPSTRLSQSGEILASIAAHRSTEPRRLGATVRGELDWIVLKTLEKDRRRRYESAGNLAADIDRYLEGRPVEAAPAGAAYRMRKFLRRHRLGVAAAAMVAAALVVGLGTAMWQAGVAARERDAARRAGAEAESRRKEMEQVAEFQESQLADVDAALMGQRLRASLLADAKESMQRRDLAADQIADRQGRLGELLADANLTNVALEALDENIFEGAMKAVDEQFKDQPLVRARLLQTIALTLNKLSLLERATVPQAEALAVRRRLLGDDHPDTIASIIDAALLFMEKRDLPESERLSREAIDRLRETHSTDDAAMGVVRSNLGMVQLFQGRMSEAESEFRAALEALRRAHGDGSPEALTAMENLGGVLMETGRPAEAEGPFRGVLGALRRVKGEDAPETIRATGNLGFALEQQGKLTEAEPYYRESLEKHRRVLGDDHADTIQAINNMAWLEDELGRHDRAEAFYSEAIARARRTLGDKNAMTLRYIGNLGHSRRERGKPAEAEALFREALAGLEPQLGRRHVQVAISMAGVGGSLLDLGRLAEAEPLLLDAAGAFAGAQGVAKSERRRCLQDLVALYETWNAREPGKGFDTRAERWREELGKGQ